MPGNHTSQLLSEKLKEVIENANLKRKYSCSITTDAASNIAAAVDGNSAEWASWVKCVNHAFERSL